MEMGFNEFVEKVRKEMEETLGKETVVMGKTKNNGIKLHGLAVKGEAGQPMPILYMESFFERYQESGNWEGIMEDILASYEINMQDDIDMGWFKEYEKVKGRLTYRLVNYEANKEMLEDMVYERYLDLAKVCYVSCMLGEERASIPVNKGHLPMWGVTETEIKMEAEKNTPVLMPVKYGRIQDILRQSFEEMMTEEEKKDGCLEIWGETVRLDGIGDPVPRMYVLGSQPMLYGAAAICYPGVLERIAEEAESDLVVLPSSVHEVIVVPVYADMGHAVELKEMVHAINRSEVPWEDVLSDNVYIYRKDVGSMEIV